MPVTRVVTPPSQAICWQVSPTHGGAANSSSLPTMMSPPVCGGGTVADGIAVTVAGGGGMTSPVVAGGGGVLAPPLAAAPLPAVGSEQRSDATSRRLASAEKHDFEFVIIESFRTSDQARKIEARLRSEDGFTLSTGVPLSRHAPDGCERAARGLKHCGGDTRRLETRLPGSVTMLRSESLADGGVSTDRADVLERVSLGEECFDLLRRERLGDQVALDFVAAQQA